MLSLKFLFYCRRVTWQITVHDNAFATLHVVNVDEVRLDISLGAQPLLCDENRCGYDVAIIIKTLNYVCFFCKPLGSSFTNLRNSRPCMYGLNTSGMTRPWSKIVRIVSHSWKQTYLGCLVILHKTAECTLRST
jgi:hypothetical protein